MLLGTVVVEEKEDQVSGVVAGGEGLASDCHDAGQGPVSSRCSVAL